MLGNYLVDTACLTVYLNIHIVRHNVKLKEPVMSYIKGILKEEYERLNALSRKYRDKVGELPKGCVSIKNRRGLHYLYLASRTGGKVSFQYIGPAASENARAVLKKIEQRKNYENKLKQVRKDIREIQKALHGRKL
jgi:hypothetical protein